MLFKGLVSDKAVKAAPAFPFYAFFLSTVITRFYTAIEFF